MSEIAENFQAVQAEIAKAASAIGRDPDRVSLVAVSKRQGPERILPALQAGHRLFGENRVQEAQGKWPDLRAAYPDARLHLIGPLQTNKVKEALALFDAIQTLDREKLAIALAKARDQGAALPDLLVQVNTGEESQKAGIAPQQAEEFIAHCRTDLALPVTGVMCIPPVDEEPAFHFGLLAGIQERCGLRDLSMGMSGDYPTAVSMGATMIRVGTALFGSRPPV
ncbi:MAG: YggS family pyridoxal phosphate-dependent enzyme [Rhodospirillaceae bacterium]